MPDLDIVGSAGVDVVPVAPNFHNKLKAIILPAADAVGLDAGKAMGNKMGDALRATLAGIGTQIGAGLGEQIARAMRGPISGALPDAVQAGGRRATATAARSGEETGGAFARSMKAKLEAAFKSMPKLDIKIGDTGAEADLARLRAKIETLSNKRVGIDITAADAAAKVAEIDAELRRVGALHPNPVVRVDVATARAALADVTAELETITRNPWTVDVRPGNFRTQLIAQVEAAQALLPVITIDASTSAASAQLEALRAQIAAIPERLRTDANFNDAEALAHLATLRAQLDELNRRGVSIDVRADAARASAELGTIQAQADALNASRPRIKVDTSDATSDIIFLGIQIAALAAIPAVPVLAAGIGGIASAALAAGAGVGALALVAAPAFAGIATALQAQSAAQKQSTSATTAGANAAVTARQRALSLAGAEQQLASAKRTAAQQIASANQHVGEAERSLADAQKAAKQAQDDLVAARKTAAQQLADLNNQLADGALAQRQDTLQVQQAQAELQATMANPASSQLQREQAQLTYDQAVQQLKEQGEKYKDLQTSAKAQQKAGVNGAQVVIDANNKLATAQQNVRDQARALVDAQKAVAQAQAQAADSIASAQRGIQSAMLSTQMQTAHSATATDKYREALAKLSPSARVLFDAFAGPHGLRSALKGWSLELQPEVLPLFTRGVDGAKATLPGLTPLVHSAAKAVGELQDRASGDLKRPFWQGFKTDISTSALPAIVGLGVGFGNVLKGMAGVVDAFLPHMGSISVTIQRITGRFARWGTGLKGSPQFEAFLAYAARVGPGLAHTIGEIAGAFLAVSKALSPLSGPVLQGLASVAHWVANLATHYPWLVRAIWLGIAAFKVMKLMTIGVTTAIAAYQVAVALATGETTLFDAVLQGTVIIPLIEAIIVIVALLVIGVIYAYKHWGWFHTAVVAAWTGIKIAALFVWNDVLKPAFNGIWIAMKAVGAAAMWLWTNAISPAFTFIWLAARILFAIVAVAVIAPLIIAFHALAATGTWLWTNALKPAFDGIATGAVWLWHHVLQPIINDYVIPNIRALGVVAGWLWKHAFKPAFDAISAGASWLWKNALKPAFEGIATVAEWLWSHALSPAFDKIKEGVGLVGAAFGKAKDFIASVWSKITDVTKTPVNFIIKSVYTDGIKAVWDKVASFVHLSPLPAAPKLLAAGGTVGNGWGPAAPMMTNRPTAIVGEGNPRYPEFVIPTDPKYRARAQALHAAAGTRLMASGGIIGSAEDILGSAVNGLKSVGTSAWDKITDLGDIFLHPSKVWDALSSPLHKLIAKVGNYPFAHIVGGVPTAMLSGLGSKLIDFMTGGGNGGGGTIGTALNWARTQAGKPYQWGGTGNPSWDCSGFIGGIESALLGQNPDRRLFTTMAFQGANAPAGWALNASSPFRIGVTNAGVGHMAGTIGGVNVESQGTDGVLVGPRARGWDDALFTEHYGFVGKFDNGGYLPTGTSLVHNFTGKPEPVFTDSQWNSVRQNGLNGEGDVNLVAHVYVGDREITDIARVEVERVHDATALTLSHGRKG